MIVLVLEKLLRSAENIPLRKRDHILQVVYAELRAQICYSIVLLSRIHFMRTFSLLFGNKRTQSMVPVETQQHSTDKTQPVAPRNVCCQAGD